MKKQMTDPEWTEHQFDDKYLGKSLRNVLLHTFFIEKIIIESSLEKVPWGKKDGKYRGFKRAINILKIEKSDPINEICNTRDVIVHRCAFAQDKINKNVGKLNGYIVDVYDNSVLVRDFFIDKFGFDPKDKVKSMKHVPNI